ncbi:MAG: T9SS type A sorting domain-containing protein [Saprospiraceae bacterium]|nr:T9SS type A sorting domain-containing protein [Saprospiraceae bacterium]
MAQKTFFLLLIALAFVNCNKEIESVEVPPFSVYPNPSLGVVRVSLNPAVTTFANVTLYDRNGKTLQTATLLPQETVAYQLGEDGIYYLEVLVDNQRFKEEILNLTP